MKDKLILMVDKLFTTPKGKKTAQSLTTTAANILFMLAAYMLFVEEYVACVIAVVVGWMMVEIHELFKMYFTSKK